MRVPRFRIGWIMVLIAIVALNFAAIRACFFSSLRTGVNANKLDVLALGSLPMANFLVIGLLIALRYRGSRPFLLGFEASGAAALALYLVGVGFYCDSLIRPYLFRFQNPVFDAIGRSEAHIPIFQFTAAVILGWPQMALALLGGLLTRKLEVAGRLDWTRC